MAKINQDGDGSGIDEHLNDCQELGAQQDEEARHCDEDHHQEKGGSEQVFDQYHTKRRHDGQH